MESKGSNPMHISNHLDIFICSFCGGDLKIFDNEIN